MNSTWPLVTLNLWGLVLTIVAVYVAFGRAKASRDALTMKRMELDLMLRRWEREEQRAAFTADVVRVDPDAAASTAHHDELIGAPNRELVTDLNQAQAEARPDDDAASLVKEIGHSLKTPLSQIEVALKLLSSANHLSPDDLSTLERARTSVAICNAYIQSYRELFSVDTSKANTVGGSLRDAIKHFTSGSRVSVVVDVPDTVANYNNSFLLVTLLPLIENAIESAPKESVVHVTYTDRSGAARFEVENEITAPLPENPFEPGLTTKTHHDGMGLSVVKRLASSVPGARYECQSDSERVLFWLELPKVGPQ
jgi:K+-sensing histidine kinase KdpD